MQGIGTVNSIQQPSTSVSVISTSSAPVKSRKRPLYQKDFLLDLDDHRSREVLKVSSQFAKNLSSLFPLAK